MSPPDEVAVNAARSSRLLDASVAGVGIAVATAAVAESGRLAVTGDSLDLLWLLGIPLIMVMGWVPMQFGRSADGIEVGLDSCVLVFLATVTDPFYALAIWAVGNVLCQALTRKRRVIKLFNVGLSVLAAALALLVFSSLKGDSLTSPRELVAIGLAASVYFGVDVMVSALSLSLEEGTPVNSELPALDVLTAFVAFLTIASLGYLAVLVVRWLPDWTAILLAVPVATVLFASRAHSRGSEQARRLKVLLDTAVCLQTVGERAEVLEALVDGARDLVRSRRVELRSRRAETGELAVAFRGETGVLWLTAPARTRPSTSRDDLDGLSALVAVAEDAASRLRLSDAMSHLAWHDPLTGLANRSLFMDRIQHAVQMQNRRGGEMAVLFCDLDGFKRVNDLFGHAAGDALLVEVAGRVQASVRPTDTVARLGGDEFAVLLEGLSDHQQLTQACERVLAALRRGISVVGEDVAVTTTIGVATWSPGTSADALLSQADLAMYHGKRVGKNRFELYQPAFGEQRRQRIELVEHLRNAIDARQLEVFYQPIVSLATREILGVEALVRWRRDGVLVPPELFIPTAEESGLIIGLGDVVLDVVAADSPRLVSAAGRRLSIGVNVSAQQMQYDEFVPRVEAALASLSDVELVLEVTERDFIHNEPQTLEAMNSLAALGVQFAIDDFGIGFSSIGYLQRLPVRIVKIDRSFLSHIEKDHRACSLVRSIVVMGEALGLQVVVEGIERQSQLAHVVSHGKALVGQGFLFGIPMRCDTMVDVLAQDRRRRDVSTVVGAS